MWWREKYYSNDLDFLDIVDYVVTKRMMIEEWIAPPWSDGYTELMAFIGKERTIELLSNVKERKLNSYQRKKELYLCINILFNGFHAPALFKRSDFPDCPILEMYDWMHVQDQDERERQRRMRAMKRPILEKQNDVLREVLEEIEDHDNWKR